MQRHGVLECRLGVWRGLPSLEVWGLCPRNCLKFYMQICALWCFFVIVCLTLEVKTYSHPRIFIGIVTSDIITHIGSVAA